MLGSSFYHGTIRKYVTLFGSMFNDIYIDRIDSSNNALQSMRVPISYGPKDRYIARAQQNPDLLRPVSQVFPRMAFEINSIRYDPQRKLNTVGRNSGVNSYINNVNTQFNPVAYDFDITLSIIARNSDDATRIVEQILPFFTPDKSGLKIMNITGALFEFIHIHFYKEILYSARFGSFVKLFPIYNS